MVFVCVIPTLTLSHTLALTLTVTLPLTLTLLSSLTLTETPTSTNTLILTQTLRQVLVYVRCVCWLVSWFLDFLVYLCGGWLHFIFVFLCNVN